MKVYQVYIGKTKTNVKGFSDLPINSLNLYHSCFRGLTPRLGMYISQGSIFFASYEFLKTLFALDVETQSQSSKHESKRNDSPLLHNS